MSTSVYLRLSNGRLVSLLTGADKHSALAMKEHLGIWVASGQTLSVTNSLGRVEDITPRGVQAIEVVDEPPTRPDPNVE